MKRKCWGGLLAGALLFLMMVLPSVVHASLDIYGSYGGNFLGLNNENIYDNYGFSDGTLNKDAYIEPGTYFDSLGANTNGWRIFNDGGQIDSDYASGIIFGYPWSLTSGSLYNNSGYIEGYTNGVKMGAGTVTNSGEIYGYYDYGIYQYSEGASNFTVLNGVNVPLSVAFNVDTGEMTIIPGTPEVTGIGTIAGYGGGIYSYIGGAGAANITNYGLINGYGGAGIYLGGNGTSTATVTNSGTIIGGYGGYGYAGVDIDGVLTATVTNSGTIEGDDEGVHIGNTNTATVTNNTGATIRGYEGLDFYDVGSVTVTNSGTIRGRYGIDIDGANTVDITNNAGGTIRGQYGINIDEADTVNITNAGSIRGEYGIYIDDSGDVKITNNSGGTISGEYGVYIEYTDSAEVINNAGGTISGDYGVLMQYIGSEDTAKVTNSGDIYGEYFGVGIFDATSAEVTNNVGGKIIGYWNGVDIEYVNSATVNNAGTITGYGGYGYTGNSGDYYGYGYGYGGDSGYGGFGAYGVLAYDVYGAANITNSGTITGYAADGSGGDGGTGDDYYIGSSGSGGNGGMGMGAWIGLGISVSGAESAYVENSGTVTGYGGDGYGGDGGNWIGDYYGYSGNGGYGGTGYGGFIGGIGIGITQVEGLAEVVNSGTVTGYGGFGVGGDGGDADYDYYGYGGNGGDGIGGNGFGVSIVDAGSAIVTNSSNLTISGYGGYGIGGDGGEGYYNEYYYGGNGGYGIGANGYGVFITNWDEVVTSSGVGDVLAPDGVTAMESATVNNSGVINGFGGMGYGGYGYYGGMGYGGNGYGVYVDNAKVVMIENSGAINGIGGNGYGGSGYYDYGGYGGYGYGVYVTNAETSVTVNNLGGTISGTSGSDDIGYGGFLLMPGVSGDGGGYGYSAGVYIEHTPDATINNIGGIISGADESEGYYAYSEAYGVLIDAIWDSATDTAAIANSGTISASATGYGDNDGYAEADAYGAYIDDADTVTVINGAAAVEGFAFTPPSGTISGTAFAQGDYYDGLSASAYGVGLFIEDAPSAVTVTNYGTISGSGTALGDFAWGSETEPDYDSGDAVGDADGLVILHTETATVNNFGGTISATGLARGYSAYSDAYGVYIDSLWDSTTDSATINNTGSITASASGYGYFDYGDADAYGVYIDDADTVTVTNGALAGEGFSVPASSGTISGTAFAQGDYYDGTSARAYGAGLYIEDAPTSVTVTNYGTVSGSGTALGDFAWGSETEPDYDSGNAVGDADGIYIEHSADVTINNIGGTISATGLARGYSAYSDAYGVYIDSLWDSTTDSATINNTGSITASASGYGYFDYGDADAYGVYIDDADTVTVINGVAEGDAFSVAASSGTISATAFAQGDSDGAEADAEGLYIEQAYTKAEVTNYGTISATSTALGDMPYGSETEPDYDSDNAYAYAGGVSIEHSAEATVNNFGGTINGTATANGYYAYADGWGVWIDSLWDESGDTATVNNTGTISGSATANSYYDYGEAYGSGLWIDDADTVTVLNGAFVDEEENLIVTGGTISGTATANGYNGYSGYAYGYGVYIEDAETATVTNYGTITGTASGYGYGGGYGYGVGYGVYMEDIYGAETATVTNVGGTISGTGTGSSSGAGYGDGYGYGVYMSNVDSAAVTNGAINGEVITGGTISGTGTGYGTGYGGGYGVYITNAGSATVTNYGTISGDGSGGATGNNWGYGIYIDSTVDWARIYNYGVISAYGDTGNTYAIYAAGANAEVTLGTGSLVNALVWTDSTYGNKIILDAADTADANIMAADMIEGFGSMNKTGDGSWTLLGDADYTPSNMSLTIEKGILALGYRDTTSGVTVSSFNQTNGSLGYLITPEGDTGALTVTGNANFNNGTVTVIPFPNDASKYALETVYEDVLTVNGTISNQWTEVTAHSVYLIPSLVLDEDYAGAGSAYDLVLQRLSFTTGADNSSVPLGELLDELYPATDDPQLLGILDQLLALTSEAEARKALDELSGGSHTAFQLMSFNGLGKYLGVINHHMGAGGSFAGNRQGVGFASYANGMQLAAVGGGNSMSDAAPILLALAGNVVSQGQLAAGTNWGLWAEGYYSAGNRRSDELIAKYKHTIFGGVMGFDYRIAKDLFLGISAGLSRSDLKFDDLQDNGNMDSYQGSLYMCYNGKPWYAAGVFTYAYNKYELERYITLGPAVAQSDYKGNEFVGYAEVGYKIDAGPIEIRPLAAFQIDYLSQDAFIETGAGIYNLAVEKRDTGSYQSFLGVNLSSSIKLGGDASLKPEFRLKWAHEFSNDEHLIRASFDGGASGSFTVAPEQLSRDSAIIGAGLNLIFNKHVAAYVQYDAELNGDFFNNTILGGLRISW